MTPDVPPEPLPPPAPLSSDFAVAAAAGLGVAAATLLLGFPAQYFNIGIGLWFTEVALFLGIPWLILRKTGRAPVEYVGLRLGTGWPVLFGLLVGAANFFALVIPIQALVQSVAPQSWREVFDSARLLKGRGRWDIAAIVSGVSLAAPFCEEFFFRGVFQRGLTRRRVAPGLLVAATVFGAAHFDPLNFLALVELGVLFGLLYLRSGSIWPGVAAHAANNLISVLIFFVGGEAHADEVPEPAAVLTFGALGGLALLALLLLSRQFPKLLAGVAPKGSGSA